MTDLETYLKEVEERCDAATEGPWKFYPMSDNKHHHFTSCDRLESIAENGGSIIGMMEAFCEKSCMGKCDLTFIAHARTDVPRLLNIINQLVHLNSGLLAVFRVHKLEIAQDFGNSNIAAIEHQQSKLNKIARGEG